MIEVKREAAINLKEIEVDSTGQPEGYYSKEMSKGVPFITYTKSQVNIDFNDLIYLKLHNDEFLPWIELKFKDSTNKSFDELFPGDNEIISLFIKSQTEDYWPIRMDFKIITFNPINDVIQQTNTKTKKNKKSNRTTYNVVGVLDIDYLYYRLFLSNNDTSYNTLDKLAKNSNLGFCSNMSNTNDNMTWINPANSIMKHIKEITKNSYKSNDSFLFSYIDFYYNLNFIDIETELGKNISDDEITLNEVETYIDKYYNKTRKVRPKLTNHPDYISIPELYIEKYNIDNSTTKINIERGYKSKTHYYNFTKNKYIFKDIDSISTPGNDDQIVLKTSDEISNFAINSEYLGKLDEDNQHENFFVANIQNDINLEFLQKMKMVVLLRVPNWGLYRFQKINVELYKLSEIDMDENAPPDNSNKLNKKLSGEWLITSINYTYSKGKGTTQSITLVKRELSSGYEKRKY
jgi:hypothetical protein